MTQPASFFQEYSLLVELCQIGARPPVIRAMLGDSITTSKIHTTYKDVTGSTPPQGQLPQSVSAHLKSPVLRIHTTTVSQLFPRTDPRDPMARRIIDTYYLYLQMVGDEAVYDFQRIWFLCRATKNQQLKVVSCRTCSGAFASDATDITDEKSCPYCSLGVVAANAANRTDKTVATVKTYRQLDFWESALAMA